MPDAIITSTASTFGTISGTFAADQSTITGTVSGIVPGTLSGSVGVPGPAGSPGAPGVGVPAGGTAGQYLQKIDGVDYNTDWVTLNLSGYALLSGADFTGRVTVPGIAGDESVNFPGFNIVPTQTEPTDKVDGDLWVYDDEGLTPSKFRVFLAGSTYNVATESWVSSLYAPIVSPAFTGNPTAPTQATSDNSTKIATTAFVKAQGYAPLASPAFTGNPTAPTAALADNDTSIATTAFVQQELLSGTANAKNLEVYVRNQTGSTIPAGSIVYINGATGNRPTVTLAQANNDANSAQTFGFVKTAIANNGFGYVIVRGELENIDTSALTEGVQLYLSPTTPGAWTTTKPSAPQHLVYVGIVVRSHPTQGVILVAVQNGYELNELHDVAISSPTNGQVLKYDSSTNLWYNGTDSSGVAWGGITGTLSAQLDLQTALDGKYSTSNPAGYITSSALTPYALLSGATFTGKVNTIASATGGAGLNLPHGAAPTSPVNGDIWTTTTSLQWRRNGTTATVANSNLANTFSAGQKQTVSHSTTNAGLRVAPIAGDPSTLVDGDVWHNLTTLKLRARVNAVSENIATESFVTSQGYITSAALTGYATESWVTSQGYLTSAPVTSVAGRTGAVVLSNTDISGLGTMATQTATDYSTTTVANGLYYPLSGNPSGFITSSALTPYLTSATAASTYQTISGMSSYLTTASAASTYFTIASAANKADLASPALTGTPTSPVSGISTRTSQIATRSDTWASIMCPGLRITPLDYVQSAVVGTGAMFSSFQPSSSRLRGPNALTVGSALQRSNNSSTNSNNNSLFSRGVGQGSINWTKPVAFAIRCMVENTTSGTIFRITVGKATGVSTGDLTTQGIGVKQTGTGALVLQSHNGTTLTSTTSSFTPTVSQSFDLELYSDGAGNAYLYVNDAQVATNTGAPTTASTTNGGQYMLEVVSDGTQASQAAYYFSTQKIFYGV